MFSLKLIIQSLRRDSSLYGLWILSLGLAVTGLLIVDVFRQSLGSTLRVKGRQILTADVAVSARRILTETELNTISLSLPTPTDISDLTEMVAMVTAGSGGLTSARLGSVRFIDDAYPLVGDLAIVRPGDSSRAYPVHGRDLSSTPRAWVAPDLLTLMNLKIGDPITIGHVVFTIDATTQSDSSQTFRFGSLNPRVYVHRRYLGQTKLIKFGSTLTQTRFAKTALPTAPLKALLERKISDPGVEVTTPADLAQGSFRVLSRLLDFLGLTGLVTLSMGWIAVYYLGRRWLNLEGAGAGVLRCLGYSSADLRRFLVLKLSLIMTLGVALGAALAWYGAGIALPLVRESLPVEFELQWAWASSVVLLLIGPIAGILLLLPSIRAVSRIAPLRLVQGDVQVRGRLSDLIAFTLTTAFLFAALTLAQARSWRVTLIFLGALMSTLLVVSLTGMLFVRLAARAKAYQPGWRLHLAFSLWSSRRALAILLITVSALAGLLSQLVPNIEKTLVGELQTPPNLDRPSLFLFDIQDEQLAPLTETLARLKVSTSQRAPFVHARILSVNGQPFERATTTSWSTREEEMDARFRNRGVNVSFRSQLAPGETIAEGKPWARMSSEPAGTDVSIETGFADRLKLRIGDALRFDIQGLELDAKIANLRHVDWNSFEPNFFILFPDGVLEESPKTWILTLKKNNDLKPTRIQTELAQRFPNVTSINVQEALDNITELFGRLAGGLRVASALCLVLGTFVFLMILLFQLASSKRDRMQLRILGLTNREVFTLQLLTYGLLALLGLILGSLMSILVAGALARFAFAAPLALDWLRMFQIFVCTALASIVGISLVVWSQSRSDSLTLLIGE